MQGKGWQAKFWLTVAALSAGRFSSWTNLRVMQAQSPSFWHRGWNSTSWFPQRSGQMIPNAFLALEVCEPVHGVSVSILWRRIVYSAYSNGFVLGCIILTGLVGNDISPFLFLAVLGIWCVYSASKGFCICTWEYLSCHNNRGLKICC